MKGRRKGNPVLSCAEGVFTQFYWWAISFALTTILSAPAAAPAPFPAAAAAASPVCIPVVILWRGPGAVCLEGMGGQVENVAKAQQAFTAGAAATGPAGLGTGCAAAEGHVGFAS
jgi:hypothetical protein